MNRLTKAFYENLDASKNVHKENELLRGALLYIADNPKVHPVELADVAKVALDQANKIRGGRR